MAQRLALRSNASRFSAKFPLANKKRTIYYRNIKKNNNINVKRKKKEHDVAKHGNGTPLSASRAVRNVTCSLHA